MKGGRKPMKLPLYQVDAFTSRMFGGNYLHGEITVTTTTPSAME